MSIYIQPETLRIVYWTAGVLGLLCILGISLGLDFAEGLNRRRGLVLIWTSSSLLLAIAVAVLILLTHS